MRSKMIESMKKYLKIDKGHVFDRHTRESQEKLIDSTAGVFCNVTEEDAQMLCQAVMSYFRDMRLTHECSRCGHRIGRESKLCHDCLRDFIEFKEKKAVDEDGKWFEQFIAKKRSS